MKRLLLTISLILATGMILAGCMESKTDDISGKLKDKLSKVESQEENDDEQEPEAKTETKPIKEENEKDEISLLNGVYLRRRSDTHYRDNRDLLINYEYELIALGPDSQDKYPELYKKLVIVNDLIATEESNCFMSDVNSVSGMTERDYQTAADNELMPHKMQWNIFTRRADSEIFSIVSRSMTESAVDYNRIRYTGYNFETETGNELRLSDVVDDEDAFCTLVAEKVNEVVSPIYGGDFEDVNPSDIKEKIIFSERGNWTIDPQGITVWFGSLVFAPDDVNVTVLYSDDKEGTIFNGKYADHVPEKWTMSFPLYSKTFFDADDDGRPDEMAIFEDREYYGEDDPYGYVSGIDIEYNGKRKTFENFDDPYNIRLTLVRDHEKTFLMNVYNEYDYSYSETYSVSNGAVTYIGGIDGSPASIPYDEIEDGDYVVPDRLVTDPEYIPVDSITDMLSTCGAQRSYRLDENGKLETLDTYYTIGKDNRFTITLKVDLKDVPVVDDKTHEETSESADLKTGDKITMEYTDNDTYTDCRTKDGKLVRIRLYHHPDEWEKYVKQDGKDISVYDAFDDMMFAG